MKYIIVLMTASNQEEAKKIVNTLLLEERLIACANIINSISSFFWWQGKIETEKEAFVIMKSHESLFNKISQRICIRQRFSKGYQII